MKFLKKIGDKLDDLSSDLYYLGDILDINEWKDLSKKIKKDIESKFDSKLEHFRRNLLLEIKDMLNKEFKKQKEVK